MISVVREGVSVVFILDLAFGYCLAYGLFVVASRVVTALLIFLMLM